MQGLCCCPCSGRRRLTLPCSPCPRAPAGQQGWPRLLLLPDRGQCGAAGGCAVPHARRRAQAGPAAVHPGRERDAAAGGREGRARACQRACCRMLLGAPAMRACLAWLRVPLREGQPLRHPGRGCRGPAGGRGEPALLLRACCRVPLLCAAAGWPPSTKVCCARLCAHSECSATLGVLLRAAPRPTHACLPLHRCHRCKLRWSACALALTSCRARSLRSSWCLSWGRAGRQSTCGSLTGSRAQQPASAR